MRKKTPIGNLIVRKRCVRGSGKTNLDDLLCSFTVSLFWTLFAELPLVVTVLDMIILRQKDKSNETVNRAILDFFVRVPALLIDRDHAIFFFFFLFSIGPLKISDRSGFGFSRSPTTDTGGRVIWNCLKENL